MKACGDVAKSKEVRVIGVRDKISGRLHGVNEEPAMRLRPDEIAKTLPLDLRHEVEFGIQRRLVSLPSDRLKLTIQRTQGAGYAVPKTFRHTIWPLLNAATQAGLDSRTSGYAESHLPALP